MMFQIGIDMGGTFTDFVSVSPAGSRMLKIPSNPEDPLAVLSQGLAALAGENQLTLAEYLGHTDKFVHGTTVAINALLQKRLAKTALITTDGFRDALEIRRSQLKNQWDLRAAMPAVLVPRHLRFGVRERMDYRGQVLQPLDLDDLGRICAVLRQENVEAVACCLLFAFKNPLHEEKIKDYLKKQLPGVFITISSEVAPKIKEYERTSTTVLNACLGPRVSGYLNALEESLRTLGLNSPLFFMQNSGGLSDAAATKNYAARMLMSGPAGGAVGGKALGRMADKPNLIIADMGGTSFDLSLVIDGEISVAAESEIEGYPLTLPMVQIHSVGAGGGSIAAIDGGGILRVGPESAGALPGPVCYGNGGDQPTVTDAALVLGLLNADYFLGGSLSLDKSQAAAVLSANIAAPLGITVEDAAMAIYRIAVGLMTDAVHLVTVQKGLDPVDFVLVAAGGASPLFVCEIAAGLGIRQIIIPAAAPVFCAQGMLAAGVRHDVVKSCLTGLEEVQVDEVNQLISGIIAEAAGELHRQGIAAADQKISVCLEMKYEDQHHEISLILPEGKVNSAAETAGQFHQLHRQLFGFCQTEKPAVIVNIQVTAEEKTRKPTERAHQGVVSQEPLGQPPGLQAQALWNPALGKIALPVFLLGQLAAEQIVAGPALIQTPYTTILVTDAFQGCLDSQDNFILTAKEESADE